ncbi:response regulator [Accumulibacter sp.]|uniref:response regulator n=1 Tax=Accumulibacter sp. TaxID=2053492 RepID=UPI0026185172|nr:response regulator [Accumulibacter sp.]
MEGEFTVFVVDDVEASRRMVEAALGRSCQVETFASGAACLERMQSKVPDLFLLDVEMPGMDGYTLCRKLKDDSAGSRVPVVFVSGLADLDSCLAGYDAGGDDFVVKPFKAAELKQKVAVWQRDAEKKSSLQQQIEASDTLASLIMSNLDEYAALVKFLRALNGCTEYRQVGDEIFGLLRAYRLEGAVQLRLPGIELTLNANGDARPVEGSILRLMRCMDTITSYRNRLAIHYERASLLVANMPLDDADLCGRLRDHLAIAVETTDARLAAMHAQRETLSTRSEISALLDNVTATVHDFSQRYEAARYRGSETRPSAARRT